jgi:hypothetical protein
MQNIVYVAHSRNRDLKRARFSIINLQHFAKEIDQKHRIIVYTDAPSFFSDLDVLVEEMDNVTISLWKGARNSDERVRIMAARDAFATYHGNLVLMQNEIFYLDNPSPLFLELSNSSSLMYEDIGPFANMGYELPETITDQAVEPYNKTNQKSLPTPDAETSLYDMGLVGIHESDRSLLKKVLCYHDALLAYLPDALAASLAFSFVLGKNTLIQEANDWVDQYDKSKKSVDGLIQGFFRENELLPIEVQPTEAWRLAHQFDGSAKFSEKNIMDLVREIIP